MVNLLKENPTFKHKFKYSLAITLRKPSSVKFLTADIVFLKYLSISCIPTCSIVLRGSGLLSSGQRSQLWRGGCPAKPESWLLGTWVPFIGSSMGIATKLCAQKSPPFPQVSPQTYTMIYISKAHKSL